MPAPRHLFNSRCKAEVMVKHRDGARVTTVWEPAGADDAEKAALAYFKCRIDPSFLRPGKDILPAPNAGEATDRVAILFYGPEVPLRAGMRLTAVPNDYGRTPIKGTWELRSIPDEAIGFSDVNHREVQVIETQQVLDDSNWPEDGSGG